MKTLRLLPLLLLAAAALTVPATASSSTHEDPYFSCHGVTWHDYAVTNLELAGPRIQCYDGQQYARYFIDHGSINEHWSCYTSLSTAGTSTIVGCVRHDAPHLRLKFHYHRVTR